MSDRGVGLLRAVGAAAVVAGVVVGCAACTSTSSESWSDPSVSGRESRVLTVMAHGTSSGDGACTPLVHLEAVETGAEVVVRAVTSRPTFSDANCPAVLLGPRPFSVTLKKALGHREVVDAQTGATEPVLDGSVLPTIAGLPRAFVQRSLYRGREGALVRVWAVHSTVSYPGVTLSVGPAGSATVYPGSSTKTIHGIKVAFWSDGGESSQNFVATWTPNSGEQAQITVSAPTGRWSEAETLALVTHAKRL